MGCQPLLRIWSVSFCFSFTDCLSRHIFPHVPLGLLSISLRFFSFTSLYELCFKCSNNVLTDSHWFLSIHHILKSSFGWLHQGQHNFACGYSHFLTSPFHFISLTGNLIPFFSALAWLPSFLQYFAAVFILCCFSVSLLSYWQSNRRVLK